MLNTTVTFRTDKELKEQATELFESLGMNLSVAINMFMRQAVARQQFPCSLEYEISRDCEPSYPAGFFNLFGAGADLGLDDEPEELSYDLDRKVSAL